jgi:hypothetical protein
MNFQIIVCGMAVSADGAEWGLVVVGLTEGGARGRAIVLADESGRMASGEAARRLAALGATGKVQAAPVAKDAAERLAGVLAMAARDGAQPPPAWPMVIGDSDSLWMGVLLQVHEAGRFAFNVGLDALEAAVKDYRPGADAPRVGALLAAVAYLRDIGGLVGAGEPWSERPRSPTVADAMIAGQDGGRMNAARRLGAVTD